MGSIISRMAITSWPHHYICSTLVANLYVLLPFWLYGCLPAFNVQYSVRDFDYILPETQPKCLALATDEAEHCFVIYWQPATSSLCGWLLELLGIPLLWVVDESWVGSHNERMRDLQFTCLLHIHKGGGSELFGYGQSNSYMVGTEQVRLSVQQGERRSSQDVEVVGEEGREWGVTEVSDFFLHPSCPSTSSYLLDLTYPVTEVLS